MYSAFLSYREPLDGATMQSLKWAYHAIGLKLEVKLFASPRVAGVATKMLQGKNLWRPASVLARSFAATPDSE